MAHKLPYVPIIVALQKLGKGVMAETESKTKCTCGSCDETLGLYKAIQDAIVAYARDGHDVDPGRVNACVSKLLTMTISSQIVANKYPWWLVIRAFQFCIWQFAKELWHDYRHFVKHPDALEPRPGDRVIDVRRRTPNSNRASGRHLN